MPNGKQGDHPLTDILHYKAATYSATAEESIRQIAELVSRDRLYELFDWWNPPPIHEFERQLNECLVDLCRDAKERGWEIET